MNSIGSCQQIPRDDYEDLLGSVRDHFAATASSGPLFTTDAEGLFAVFLDSLPEHERQHHTCHACRNFVERYGGIVSIDESGRTVPVMWGDAPGFYGPAFAAVRKIVSRARVNGVFLTSERVWGQPVTGEWRHMAITPPRALVFAQTVLKTAGQARAEKREEYAMLCRGLAEFPQDVVAQALNILESEALYRNEKCLGPAKWLAELHARRADLHGRARDNITWLAVAKAPPGFCHVRSTMIGTLLEDLAAGMPFEAIRRRFTEKMNPLQYQRPQVEPDAGNIAQAEKIVAALRSAGALDRRFARIEDVQVKLWTPKQEVVRSPETSGKVFGHLKPRGERRMGAVEIPATKITWEKFARTVLPEADQIEVLVPSRGAFIALCTAVNPEAPPLMQWDREEKRNPVNWYVYPGGSPAGHWDLVAGTYVPVTAVTCLPSMWDEDHGHDHQGKGIILILQGCRDMHPVGGAALFPEVLKSEYRAVRRTMEAYSRGARISGEEEASACGIDLRKGNHWNCHVRVASKDGSKVVHYTLDRWD